mgnify:CR=1 FL=1
MGPLRLLIVFTQVTIIGFGGVLPFAYRMLVERKRLLSNEDFAQMFAFGQVVPGPAIANFAISVGYRDSGALGAAAALAPARPPTRPPVTPPVMPPRRSPSAGWLQSP